jgi:hypothetical protein
VSRIPWKERLGAMTETVVMMPRPATRVTDEDESNGEGLSAPTGSNRVSRRNSQSTKEGGPNKSKRNSGSDAVSGANGNTRRRASMDSQASAVEAAIKVAPEKYV